MPNFNKAPDIQEVGTHEDDIAYGGGFSAQQMEVADQFLGGNIQLETGDLPNLETRDLPKIEEELKMAKFKGDKEEVARLTAERSRAEDAMMAPKTAEVVATPTTEELKAKVKAENTVSRNKVRDSLNTQIKEAEKAGDIETMNKKKATLEMLNAIEAVEKEI